MSGVIDDLLLRKAHRLRKQDPFGYAIFTDEELIEIVKHELREKKIEWEKRRENEENKKWGDTKFTSKKRPNFHKNQVQSRDEIKKGNFYLLLHTSQNPPLCRFIQILSEPCQNYINWFAEIYSYTDNIMRKLYLSDVSIEPYENGTWNNTNFLLKTEFKKPPPPEIITSIIKSLNLNPF